MASCVIEEIDPSSDPTRHDDAFERILIDHQRDPKEFLATCFDFLSRKTRFFNDPAVSKTLARLLRDIKQGSKPATSLKSNLQASFAPPSHENGVGKVRFTPKILSDQITG
jgi:hypothetical protein